MRFRFVSDFPFIDRPGHDLNDFEVRSLAAFREASDPDGQMIETEGSLLDRRVTLATPVVMGSACVVCHNTHPESPRTDWRVGDVRGLQVVSVHQPIALGIGSFKWLLVYFALAGSIGFVFSALQYRLAGSFARLNGELEANNEFLAGVSMKISKYLSPQVYRSVFAGERDVAISTERKKLTVFFSDISDFTSTTEQLQPEEITQLLNEYFTEMSRIADEHGATVDKFVGDAIIAFFGDPQTKGVAQDAQSCLRMAIDMQRRLSEMADQWRERGIEHPFRARMGINTGYCNVGNFGSSERMDYTIIGAEANLAARLEKVAEPGGIVISYETYAHVSNVVEARRLKSMRFKGIAREVVAFEVILPEADAPGPDVIAEEASGMSLHLDVRSLDTVSRERARSILRQALRRIELP